MCQIHQCMLSLMEFEDNESSKEDLICTTDQVLGKLSELMFDMIGHFRGRKAPCHPIFAKNSLLSWSDPMLFQV
jgi:hypothetical protein